MALAGVLLLALETGVYYAQAASETGHAATVFSVIGTVLLIVLVVGVCFGLVTGWVGSLQRRRCVNWFGLGFYLPLLAVLAVVAVPRLPHAA